MYKGPLIMFYIIMICVSSSGCMYFSHPPEPKYYNDYYKISITPLNNTNYTVIVPVPLLNNNLSILAKDLNITKGSGNISIVDIEKDVVFRESLSPTRRIGLKIESNKSIVIEKHIKNKKMGYLYDTFSLMYHRDYRWFFIYINYTDTNMIKLNIVSSTSTLHTRIVADINIIGLNGIEGNMENVVP